MLEAKDVASGASQSTTTCLQSLRHVAHRKLTAPLVLLCSLLRSSAGRNGGHLAPATSNAYPGLVRPLAEGGAGLTPSEALHVIRSERDNFDLVLDICEKEGIANDVDLWSGEIIEGQSS